MNNKHLLMIAMVVSVLCINRANGQGMAVNSTGAAANSSAMLDVASNNQGMLVPRMSAANMNAINSPATGLLVYNTDANAFNFYNGSSWTQIGNSGTVTSVSSGNLSPVFSTSVNNATTTPSISYTLSNAAAHTFLGNSTGSPAGPTYSKVSLAADVTGNLPVGNLNSGTSASGTTFWRGDGTWAAPTSGSLRFRRVSATSDTVFAASDDVLEYDGSTSSPVTFILPSTTVVGVGRVFYLINNTTGAPVIALTPSGSDKFMDTSLGGYTSTWNGGNEFIIIMSDGAGHWIILSSS
jgi:hypothetical protein